LLICVHPGSFIDHSYSALNDDIKVLKVISLVKNKFPGLFGDPFGYVCKYRNLVAVEIREKWIPTDHFR
jgi:hypothetical protein